MWGLSAAFCNVVINKFINWNCLHINLKFWGNLQRNHPGKKRLIEILKVKCVKFTHSLTGSCFIFANLPTFAFQNCECYSYHTRFSDFFTIHTCIFKCCPLFKRPNLTFISFLHS